MSTQPGGAWQRRTAGHRGLLGAVAPLLCLAWPATAWDYVTNGNNWREGVCQNKQVPNQSPIDLTDEFAQIEPSKSLHFRYPAVGEPVRLYNDGHSLAMTLPEMYKGGFSISETRDVLEEGKPIYRIYQVNFHSPSEHTRNGQRMPLEMQLVHKDIATHKVAVISVLFTDGGLPSTLLDVLTEYGLPKEPWDEVVVNRAGQFMDREPGPNAKDIDFRFAVNGSAYYSYVGSLTIPPCEGNVLYLVRQFPFQATQDQLDRFSKLLRRLQPPRGNYRNVQPLNNRKVRLLTSTDLFDPDHFDPVVLPRYVKPGPPPLVVDTDVDGNPDFAVIKASDSDEMREAKKQFRIRAGQAKAARAGVAGTAGNAALWGGFYNGATGPVQKIDLKWKVIMANRDAKAAKVGSGNADIAYRQALDSAKAVLEKEWIAKGIKPSTGDGESPMATVSKEEASKTTMAPTEFPPIPTAIPGFHLHYYPRIRLPRGDAANPFMNERAETEARIGDLPGLPRIKYERYSATLRQPDGPIGQFPVAPLVKVTTTTTMPTTTTTPPPTTTTPPPPPATEGSVEATGAATAEEVAEALGVAPDQVEVAAAPAAPPAPAPALLQWLRQEVPGRVLVDPGRITAPIPWAVRARPWGHGL